MFTLARSSVMRAVRPRAAMAIPARRCFSAAAAQLKQTISKELKYEQENYQRPGVVSDFMAKDNWSFVEKEGDVNMTLKKEIEGKDVHIEWQLSAPTDFEMDEGEDKEEYPQATDFSLTVTAKDGAGLTFYGSTQAGEGHRFVIGNVQAFDNADEKELPSAYNGPDFEDLDDKMQEHLDGMLADLGLDEQVCDFIDATATDKEQREYIRWLTISEKILA